VDLFVQIIKDLARKHALPAFRVGWFHSEVPRAELALLWQNMADGIAFGIPESANR
jgi:hypothetical protein